MQQLLAESLDTACYPTSFSQAGRAGATFRVYSPGVCPTEYATAQSRSISETAIIVCCPRYVKSACVTAIPVLTLLQCIRLYRVHV